MSGTGRHADRAALLPADGPLRYTRPRTAGEMDRRAGRLVGMHLLLPGSAQMVAGNRIAGRLVIVVWALVWVVVLAALLAWLVQRALLVSILTSATGLTVLQVGLLVLAAGWLAVTVDVLRLARLLRLSAWARPVVGGGLVVLALVGGGLAGWGAYSAGVARGALVSIFHAATPAQAALTTKRYDVLLLGLDRPSGGGALTPKSISVLSIDASSGAATIIGVPTTLKDVPFPASSPMHRLYPHGYRDCIAAPCALGDVYREAGAVGSSLYPSASSTGTTAAVQATRDAVSGVIGREIPYTATVDTVAFGRLVDAFGGIAVQGRTRSDGAHVVAYLRGAGDGSQEVDRELRVEHALITQVNPANALLQFRTVAAASSGALRTDVPQDTVTDLAVLGLKTQQAAVRQVRLVPPTVADVSRPDFAAIHRLVAATTG